MKDAGRGARALPRLPTLWGIQCWVFFGAQHSKCCPPIIFGAQERLVMDEERSENDWMVVSQSSTIDDGQPSVAWGGGQGGARAR